jgi:hypothetical protein
LTYHHVLRVVVEEHLVVSTVGLVAEVDMLTARATVHHKKR